jgi:NADH-quinone oxidoreductase subunit M
MMAGAVTPWLPAGVPLLGAVLTLAVWSNPDRLKVSAILVSIVSLGANIGLSGSLPTPPEDPLLLYLLPLSACVSLLGQPVHRDHRLSWIVTLLFLGLGLGVLTNPSILGQFFLLMLLGSVIVLLYRYHTALWPISWWGIGTYGFGALCVAISVVAGPPLSAAASLLTCAILLPLVPFHDGHLTALTRLPGSLPAFMVLLFPAVGLHGLATIVPTVPEDVARTVSLLALAGSLYGAIKALAQSRVRLLLAYGSLSFFSMLWWFVAAARTPTPRAAVFVGAVGLVTGGLLLAWQVIRTRYGDDVDPRAISGLAFTMPRYAILLSLLALAAMGLPPFGVFAGFMGLLLTSSLTPSVGLFVLLIAWLTASWYIMQMVQQLLFGVRQRDRRYTDLLRTEFAALLTIVLVLLALGVAPPNLWGPERTAPSRSTNVGTIVWNR